MTLLAEREFLKMHNGETKESLRGSKWVPKDKQYPWKINRI
jgi:hypothetical protein